VDNVDITCSDNDLCSFVGKLSITVISCFEVKPRRRRYEENELNPRERKAFRLCIFDEDRDRLLNAAVWPDSIKISPWYFRAAAADGDAVGRNAVAAGVSSGSTGAVVEVDGAPSGISTARDTVVTAVSAAVAEPGPSTDCSNDENDGNNTIGMSDDTILAGCNLNDGV